MLIAHPDGTVTVNAHDAPKTNDLIATNAIGHWWNLKMTNDTKPGGKIRIYADNVLVGTYGHDGQQFYVIAKSIPDLQQADGHVDRLRYRARRILFPLVVAAVPDADQTPTTPDQT